MDNTLLFPRFRSLRYVCIYTVRYRGKFPDYKIPRFPLVSVLQCFHQGGGLTLIFSVQRSYSCEYRQCHCCNGKRGNDNFLFHVNLVLIVIPTLYDFRVTRLLLWQCDLPYLYFVFCKYMKTIIRNKYYRNMFTLNLCFTTTRCVVRYYASYFATIGAILSKTRSS